MSKTDFTQKIFSPALYLRQLKNTKLAGIGICVIFALSFGISAFTAVKTYSAEAGSFQADTLFFPYFLAVLLPVVLVIYSFSFLWKRNESDFYHSLPQKRTCVFSCIVSAIASWMLIAFLLAFAFTSGAFLLHGHSALIAENIKLFFGLYLSSLTIAAGSILIANLSGTMRNCIMYVLLLLPVPHTIYFFVSSTAVSANASIVPKSTALHFLLQKSSGLYSLFAETDFSAGQTIYMIIKILIVLSLSAFIYAKRDSQNAGNPEHCKKAHNVFMVVTSASFFCLTGDGYISLSLCILGLLFVFICNLILFKSSSKAIRSALPCFAVGFLCLLVLYPCALIMGSYYKKNVPEAEEVEKITLSIFEFQDDFNDNTFLVTDDFTKEIHSQYYSFIIHKKFDGLYTTDRDVICTTVEALKKSHNEYKNYIGEKYPHILKFKLKNGKEIVRNVYFSQEAFAVFLGGLRNEPENQSLFKLPDYENLKHFKAIYYYGNYKTNSKNAINDKLLYNVFKEEYSALSPESIAQCQIVRDYQSITICFATEEYSEFLFISSKYFPKTAQLFYELRKQGSKHADAEKFISDIKALNSQYKNRNLYVYPADESFKSQYFKEGDNVVHFDPPNENIDSLIYILDAEKLSDTSDVSKMYYLSWEDTNEIYILALDKNVISLLNSLK